MDTPATGWQFAPDDPRAQMELGRRFADECLAATGLDPAGIVDDFNANPQGEEGTQARRAQTWLVERIEHMFAPEGGIEESPLAMQSVNNTLNLVWHHFVMAFAIIARERAEARALEDRAAREHAEQRLAETEAKLATARKPPTLTRGTGFMRALLMTDRHVVDAVRKAERGKSIAPAEAEHKRLFQYQPLGASERLVMHALASFARDLGVLDAHPWATASGAMPMKFGEPIPRVKIEYPGTSEIARILGYAPGGSGKISGAKRTTIERALKDLATRPRWIATRVLLPPQRKGGEWVEDIEVHQELWVIASATILSRGQYLSLHPAAIASHLKSFENIPGLATQYDAARDALGAREMRDEWAILDDYVRFLAMSITGKHRREEVAAKKSGKVVAPAVAGDLTITKRVAYDTLVTTAGLAAFAKKQGRRAATERVNTALAFCEHMGSLKGFAEREGMWTLRLPYPEASLTDANQFLLLAPDPIDTDEP